MTLADAVIDVDLNVPGVRAFVTTRRGGVSTGPWSGGDGTGGLNLGLGSGDAPEAVRRNRDRIGTLLPAPPSWLQQVHGTRVVDAEAASTPVEADASTSVTPGTVCAVLIADCMPVLLASCDGRGVAAAHAGWRGLAGGIVQNTARALRARLGRPEAELVAYLGPAIGPAAFEVGPEVLEAMQARLPDAARAFTAAAPGKHRADLFALGKMALTQAGVTVVLGGGDCTYTDGARFYSFRRDRVTGRQAALIWLDLARRDAERRRV
jgi:polyphenol oxidase